MAKTSTPETPQAVAVPLTSLQPANWNPRSISDERFQNLCHSIETDPDFLWLRPILATKDGTIFAGNMRYRAAEHLGWTELPAILVDIPEQLARERALRDNAQWGEWEEDDLAALLKQLSDDGSNLDLLGFSERDLQHLLDKLDRQGGLTDPDDAPPLPEEPISKPGDLWLLGDHRLLCGDATDPHDVGIVMDGQKASCVWTDPPYGVNYQGSAYKRRPGIKNDDREGLAALLTASFASINEELEPGAAIYVAHPAGANSVVFGEAFLQVGWRLHQTLVWVKDKLVPGHSDYHYRHEPIFLGYAPGYQGRRGRGSRGWYGGDKASSVFEVPTPRRNDDHPTAKPLALIEPMVQNSSRTGEVVLDPFAGSGSTVIACERLGRRCYSIEIDPQYVDVVVTRWEAFTGKQAVKA